MPSQTVDPWACQALEILRIGAHLVGFATLIGEKGPVNLKRCSAWNTKSLYWLPAPVSLPTWLAICAATVACLSQMKLLLAVERIIGFLPPTCLTATNKQKNATTTRASIVGDGRPRRICKSFGRGAACNLQRKIGTKKKGNLQTCSAHN